MRPSLGQVERPPILSFASTKGGAGKTTLAYVVATEVARRLRRDREAGLQGGDRSTVVCIDADPNRTLSEALRITGIPDIRIVESDSERLLPDLREAQSEAALILIDLEGTANQAMLYAAGKSDLVLVPAQPSRFDVVEALKTVGVVRQAADLVGRDILYRVVLSRTPVLRQRVAEHSRQQFQKADLSLLQVELLQRSAFQTMTYNGKPPFMQDPAGSAAANVEALVDELSELLGSSLLPRAAGAPQDGAGAEVEA